MSSTFDIVKFLSELPRVSPDDLPQDPEDCKCLICQIPYGQEDQDSGYNEHPVQLQCGHVLGKACISRWLKPALGGNANICPYCRTVLFEPWPQVAAPEVDDIPMIDFNQRPPPPAHNTLAVYSRALEDAGYSLGPFLGEEATREQAALEIAANRRIATAAEYKLYAELKHHGVRLPEMEPSPTLQVLNVEQEEALFDYLERIGAFKGMSLNELHRFDQRLELQLTNRQLWDRLRDQAACWKHGAEYDRFWCVGNGTDRERILFDDDEDDAGTFEELLHQGAFRTEGVIQFFHGARNDYEIFRRVLEMRISWDERAHVWQRRRPGARDLNDLEIMFGDVPRETRHLRNIFAELEALSMAPGRRRPHATRRERRRRHE